MKNELDLEFYFPNYDIYNHKNFTFIFQNYYEKKYYFKLDEKIFKKALNIKSMIMIFGISICLMAY